MKAIFSCAIIFYAAMYMMSCNSSNSDTQATNFFVANTSNNKSSGKLNVRIDGEMVFNESIEYYTDTLKKITDWKYSFMQKLNKNKHQIEVVADDGKLSKSANIKAGNWVYIVYNNNESGLTLNIASSEAPPADINSLAASTPK